MDTITENDNICEENFIREIRRGDIQSIAKFLINDAKSVLEIGCGIGDYIVNTNPDQLVHAIEPHVPYLETSKKRAPWVEYFNTDGVNFLKKCNVKYDLILMIDVVEHLDPNSAHELIELAKKHCSNIIFSQIPYGLHEQDHDEWNMGGEYWQTHRSTWDDKNIHNLEFSFYEVIENFYPQYKEEEAKSESTIIAFWINNFYEVGKADLIQKYVSNLERVNFENWQQAYIEGYSSNMGNHRNYFYDEHLQNIGLYNALDTSQNILEYAPGDGAFMKQFIELFPNKTFTLVDISEENLGKIRNILGKFPNVNLHLNYPELNSLTNIDLAFSFLLCQSMPKSLWYSHLKTVKNMLKIDGSYVFQFAYKRDDKSTDNVVDGLSGNNKYSIEEMSDLLEKSGFNGADFTIPITLETFESDIIWYICKANK